MVYMPLCHLNPPIFINNILIDDVEEGILITFELDGYGVSEEDSSVEVCAVTSATPAPGQTAAAEISTEDGSATGKKSPQFCESRVTVFSLSLQLVATTVP